MTTPYLLVILHKRHFLIVPHLEFGHGVRPEVNVVNPVSLVVVPAANTLHEHIYSHHHHLAHSSSRPWNEMAPSSHTKNSYSKCTFFKS